MVHAPVIPAQGRLRQEDLKFQASLGNIAGPCLKTKQLCIIVTVIQDAQTVLADNWDKVAEFWEQEQMAILRAEQQQVFTMC